MREGYVNFAVADGDLLNDGLDHPPPVSGRSYAYDNGGRVTAITRDGATLNLGYNSADQVTAVTNGAGWVTYQHDAAGRRMLSTNSTGTVRRFLVAPTPGSDLESPHLIADGSGTLQQGYVYVGDEPILRYDSGGTATYYLEDGMGSISGLAPAGSPGTGNTTRLFYDGFGNSVATNGPAPSIPSSAAGDFRFHGAWLEAGSGLYNMRAREYDARMGRFISRDSIDGAMNQPESFNSYIYSYDNPVSNMDPSGKISLTELVSVQGIQTTLQTIRAVGVQQARQKAYDKISGLVEDWILSGIRSYMPIDLSKLMQGRKFGEKFGRLFVMDLATVEIIFILKPRLIQMAIQFDQG